MADLFEGSRLKIGRARHHIDAVTKLINGYAAHPGHGLKTETSADGQFQVIKFEAGDPLPNTVNLAVGDAVHNLRAALDHLMIPIVKTLTPDTKAKISHLYFPMCKDEEEMTRFREKDSVLGPAFSTELGEKVWDVLFYEVKPYGPLDQPLRMLNRLDNIDKHRLLVTLFTMTGMSGSGSIGGIKSTNSMFMSNHGTPVVASKNVSIVGDFKPAIQVRLNEPDFPMNPSLIPALDWMTSAVIEAVDAISGCFA